MILVAEDDRGIVKTLDRQFSTRYPRLGFSFVADGEDAYKAMIGEPYLELDPKSYKVRERAKCSFNASIWDNTMPRKWGENAVSDVGSETVQALAASGRVDEAIRSRFISLSSDDPGKFNASGLYVEVIPKPLGKEQFPTLDKLFGFWGLLHKEDKG